MRLCQGVILWSITRAPRKRAPRKFATKIMFNIGDMFERMPCSHATVLNLPAEVAISAHCYRIATEFGAISDRIPGMADSTASVVRVDCNVQARRVMVMSRSSVGLQVDVACFRQHVLDLRIAQCSRTRHTATRTIYHSLLLITILV